MAGIMLLERLPFFFVHLLLGKDLSFDCCWDGVKYAQTGLRFKKIIPENPANPSFLVPVENTSKFRSNPQKTVGMPLS